MNTDVEMPLSDTNYHGRGKDQVTEKDDIFLKNSLTLRLQAYGVVLGAFLAKFISVGVVNTFGIIIRASEHDPTSHFRNIGSFRLGFVTGIAAGFTFLVGPFSNILTSRLGIRFPIGLGVLLMTIALELASLTKDYWQLFLSQGVLWGLGSSLCFIPAIGLPSQWFIKNRGIATGVASSGAPVGAMILSSVIQRIINGSSLQWALRALGFIILGLGIVATVLLRPKPKLEKDSVVTQYRFMDFSVIKTRGYPVYMTFAFLQMFGYTTPVFWLPNYALSIGLTSSQGSNIIVILNAGNFVGRLTAGQLGDKLGTLNILTLFTFMAGLVCVVGWIFAHSFASLAGFSVCWGFFAGAYWSLTVPATGRIVSAEKLGSAVAINFLMNVIPPIFSASIGARLNTATAHLLGIGDSTPKAFRYLIVWSGMTYMVSALLIAFVRFMLEKRILVRI